MNIYKRWGFFDTPFNTNALPPTEIGEALLVGRDKEIETIMRHIYTPPNLVTIEGANGVGKTSVVNIASFKCYKKYLEDGEGPLYIPCRKSFQLDTSKSVEVFKLDVLMEIAQTLIQRKSELSPSGVDLSLMEQIDEWLNSPHLKTHSPEFAGWSLGSSQETNTSVGFERSGFRKVMEDLLEDIFPTDDSGGIVCVLDNLELLQTSENARRKLEELRDPVLTLSGIRWVLCGALGIVRSVVSSPRLQGFLGEPVIIESIDRNLSSEILNSRIKALSDQDKPPYLPILPQCFGKLFEVLNFNIRSTLKYANDFCLYVSDGDLPEEDDAKSKKFEAWLKDLSSKYYEDVKRQIRPRANETFECAIRMGGIFSPSDYEEFGFNSIEAMRPQVRFLEDVGLISSSIDDSDRRRKTIQIMPKGWLVKYAMDTDSNE